MEKLVLRKIGFGSYIKLFFLSGVGLGLGLGLLALIVGLCGGPITANIGETEFYGAVAGLIGFVLCPFFFSFSFFLFSLVMYPFFLLILKLLKGFNVWMLVEHKNHDTSDQSDEKDSSLQAE